MEASSEPISLSISLTVLFVVDLPAHLVLLRVEGPLLLLRDVPTILGRHIPLFLPNLVILFVQLGSLSLAQCTALDALVDPAILVQEPFVDLRPTGVALLPRCFVRVDRG